MKDEVLLQAHGLSKSFPGVQALAAVDLDIQRGEVHALVGENGAGKSTLMRILAGLESPDQGTLVFKGQAVHFRNPHQALILGIGMIHQELLPFRELTVAENIFMGREPAIPGIGWIRRGEMAHEAGRVLNRLGSRIRPQARMGELNVADMQIVEIAKALAHRAELIIMDEPTSALSHQEIQALFQVIRDLQAGGVAIIYVSHKLEEIFQLASRATVLRDGRLVGNYRLADLNTGSLVSLMVGRAWPGRPGKKRAAPGPLLLETQGLSRAGEFQGISLQLRRSEIVGVAGLLGAGRTALVNALCGLAPASSGAILVEGRPVKIRNPREAMAHGIGWAGEDRKQQGLVLSMSVKHNLTLASLAHCCRGPILDGARERAITREQINAFGIKAPRADHPVGLLSGGNQQKVVLAKTLLAEPQIILLDEPTRGIDIAAKEEIHQLIRQLAARGKAVMLVSSELPEVLSLSDRILVMRQGRITAELDPGSTSPEEILRRAMFD